MKVDIEKMRKLAELSQLTFDGGEDSRLFADDEFDISVFPTTKREYMRMEKKMAKFEIKREKYSVYVWNDCSGYDYWKNMKECNYIKITANIENPDLSFVEVHQLKLDILAAYDEFCEFHNIELYCDYLNSRGA